MGAPQHFFAGGFTSTVAPANLLARAPASLAGEALQVLTSIDDVRAAVRRTALSAQRLMSIFTEDLEPDVYDEAPFLDIIKRFVLSRNFAKVRVLTHRPLQLIGNSNRFVAMSRRLSSYIEIRVADPKYSHNASAMMIADSKAIMYRARARQWEGVAGFNQPPIARLHLTEFDEMWVGSPPEY
jgi:hypothetical protein